MKHKKLICSGFLLMCCLSSSAKAAEGTFQLNEQMLYSDEKQRSLKGPELQKLFLPEMEQRQKAGLKATEQPLRKAQAQLFKQTKQPKVKEETAQVTRVLFTKQHPFVAQTHLPKAIAPKTTTKWLLFLSGSGLFLLSGGVLGRYVTKYRLKNGGKNNGRSLKSWPRV